MVDIYELLRRDQDGTAEYIKTFLDSLGVEYKVDSYGNIFFLDYENYPLLSAHMDTVRNEEDFCIGAFLTESDDDKIMSGGILGGDDKCGVYIILRAIEAGKKVNFIFSRDEEIGCVGIKKLVGDNEICEKIKKCLWCLVLDRRGNSDIICKLNDYGTAEFESALEKISNDNNFGYKPTKGLCSDANTIRDYISTANISTGYFCPHSQKEYIVKADLETAYNYTIAVIDNLKDRFEPAERKVYDYTDYSYWRDYDNNYDFYAHMYEDDYDDYRTYGYYSKESDSFDSNVTKYVLGKTPKVARSEFCDFCQCAETDDYPLYDFDLPDGNTFKICEFCIDDLDSEMKRVKMMIPPRI